jgi:hypothetical protein
VNDADAILAGDVYFESGGSVSEVEDSGNGFIIEGVGRTGRVDSVSETESIVAKDGITVSGAGDTDTPATWLQARSGSSTTPSEPLFKHFPDGVEEGEGVGQQTDIRGPLDFFIDEVLPDLLGGSN